MQQAIENGGGRHIVAKDCSPLRDELIGGDEQAPALVAPGHQLKEEVGAAALEWQIPELVDDQELRLAEKHQSVRELALGLGARQRREEGRGADKEDGVARFDDSAAERDGEMRLLRGARYG
jgi:hypothetical protein